VGELRLGFDIGGTKVAIAVGDRDGKILARSRRPTEPSGDAAADLSRLAAAGHELLAEVGASASDLAGVGAGVPGPIDLVRGLLLSPPNLPGWHEAPIRDALTEAFGCPAFIENDANAAALAEARHGAGQGARDLVYLTMSTGVGSGLVLDGHLYRGSGGGGGELGHMPIEWNGERCSCGQRGCLEAYVGGAAWARRLRRCTPRTSQVVALAGDPTAVRPEHVVEAARQGDAFALSELERFTDLLARGIVLIELAFDPELVLLGTIAVAAGDALCFEPLREKVRAHLWPSYAERLRIEPAGLGDELPYRAALCAATPPEDLVD